MKRFMWAALIPSFAQTAYADGQSGGEARSVFAVPGEYLLIAGVIALIVALFIVGGMKAKLKTAGKQPHASRYIRPGSFDLCIQSDRFLYEKVQRRKIENKAANQSQKG